MRFRVAVELPVRVGWVGGSPYGRPDERAGRPARAEAMIERGDVVGDVFRQAERGFVQLVQQATLRKQEPPSVSVLGWGARWADLAGDHHRIDPQQN